MSKPHILQMGQLPEWDEAPLHDTYQVHRYYDAPDKGAFLSEIGPGIKAIATRGDLGAGADVIAACPALEIISVFGVGYDAVDLTACAARGIAVTNTPDVLTDDCADLALGMWLALSRGIVAADAWARSGDWALKGGFPLQHRACSKRAGILGLGRIGMAVARRLQGFGMQISYNARTPRADCADWQFVASATELATQCDVLFVTLAATAQTRHIVNASMLDALGPDGLLVNISRAQNIDEGALLDALEQGRLRGAALDVFEGEPQLNPRFARLGNVLLQPHHASGTFETRRAMGQLMRDNLAAHFAGKPLLTQVQ
ncbi:2-hydroxyacid dehydrogenase [Roseinatronobacter alkalisoli]|uniref:2-hydroxyacid dehydrogenase n=1 Tax=Roseinatronobacter alkalisoli TaxID=3028235 RepID=A0ABT5TC90_9RHOB|nr:2-hydroxyacid dehydrogenase [Roseinatronobacter sp. HJB301]MDD7972748.1 2-hydroxyacid dehydrogenase [Roseinatronobacter sp. HJB301]